MLLSFTGEEFDVRAKCVINATGPFTDTVRKMDDKDTTAICQPSAGVHIVMPGYYRYPCPRSCIVSREGGPQEIVYTYSCSIPFLIIDGLTHCSK